MTKLYIKEKIFVSFIVIHSVQINKKFNIVSLNTIYAFKIFKPTLSIAKLTLKISEFLLFLRKVFSKYIILKTYKIN